MALSTLRISSSSIEQLITEQVKQMGQLLAVIPPASEIELNPKKTVLLIHAIVFQDRKLGIFKLDFNGAGINRYHLLSGKELENLETINEHVEQTISAISIEIIHKLAWRQQIITFEHDEAHKRALANRIVEIFLNPNESIAKMMVSCQLGQVYMVENETSAVITFMNQENFNLQTIIDSINHIHVSSS